MKGNNELELNQASMIEAVQEWFDKRWTGSKQKVASVKHSGSGYSENFKVQFETSDEEKGAAGAAE